MEQAKNEINSISDDFVAYDTFNAVRLGFTRANGKLYCLAKGFYFGVKPAGH